MKGKSIIMSFINKVQKFMYGRYGADTLGGFLFKFYVILLIINIVLNSRILTFLEFIIIVIMCYRFFSKNCYQRRKENRKYLTIKNAILSPFNTIRRNIKDKDNIYKKCSRCKTTLKLPVPCKRGIKHAKCPKCKKRLTIFTLKQQKIEIIKKSKQN